MGGLTAFWPHRCRVRDRLLGVSVPGLGSLQKHANLRRFETSCSGLPTVTWADSVLASTTPGFSAWFAGPHDETLVQKVKFDSYPQPAHSLDPRKLVAERRSEADSFSAVENAVATAGLVVRPFSADQGDYSSPILGDKARQLSGNDRR